MSQLAALFKPPWQPLADQLLKVWTAIGLKASIAGIPTADRAAVLAEQLFALGVRDLSALTGGDIEAAARSAANSFAGGQFGDVLGTGLDSAAIGNVTTAASTAALQGGDVEKAVLRSLVDIGARAMDEFDIYDPWMDFDPSYDIYDPYFDPNLEDVVTLDDLGIDPDTVDTSDILVENTDQLTEADIDPSRLYPDEFGNLFLPSGEFVQLSDQVFLDSIYVDAEGNIRAPDNTLMILADQALNSTVEQMSAEIARQMEAGADKVETSKPAPPSRPAQIPPAASKTKGPSIGDTTKLLEAVAKLAAQLKATTNAIKTGTYRPPATSQIGIPRNTPVGVPITLPDGRVVLNNGNGTQTILNPDGTATTMPSSYSGASGAAGGGLLPGVSNQALLIGGAVLLGAVLLARRR